MLKKENHAKIIFHIDMNAFFCAVACILNPSLRGKAFAIGRENTYRGVISTASYEARAFGIHSAMPLSEAYRIKPDLMVVHIDYKHYVEYHKRFLSLISQYTNLYEVASIDEVYADMTEISKTRHPLVIAKEFQARLLKEHGLSCSIGIAPTLFLAKMASDMKKPLGVTVLRKRDIEKVLYPCSVKDIYGIGKKTYPKLIDHGIKTIQDFMDIKNKDLILSLIGDMQYNHSYECLKGNSTNVVDPNRYSESGSISTSITFDVPLSSEAEIIYELRKMTREVWNKMKKDGYLAKTIMITLRDSEFNTITRRKSREDYTDDFLSIFDLVTELVEENLEDKYYRLIGVGVSNLVLEKDLPKEYNLFTLDSIEAKEEAINQLIVQFQSKYGDKILYRKNKSKVLENKTCEKH